MKYTSYFCSGCLVLLAFTVHVSPTCVLESDFGFKINCAFKKSGLFRVRNLGGLKAHASLGFSLGDELGFEQSLTNLDQSRRRSVSVKTAGIIQVPPTGTKEKQEKRGKQNRIMMRPQQQSHIHANAAAMEKLSSLHRRMSSTMQPIIVPGPTMDVNKMNTSPKVIMGSPTVLPPFKPLPPKEDALKVVPLPTTKGYTPFQVPQSKGPGTIYQSENPRLHDHMSSMVAQMTHMNHVPKHSMNVVRITPSPFDRYQTKPVSILLPTTVNPFVPMPIQAPPTQSGISIIPAPVLGPFSPPPTMITKFPSTYTPQNTILHKAPTHEPNPVSNFVDPVPVHVNDLANKLYPVFTKKADEYNTISGYGDDITLKFNKADINERIAEIARAGNISMEAVEAAIALRQQQLLNKYSNIVVSPATTTTTSTTTTEAPVVFETETEPQYVPVTPKLKRNPSPAFGKVMNAPREYYPVGYEKNFDDQFQSKVDLPETTFHCGDQKYFPGLYGDENLGCMVFHVCALTDEGLVMKSFLCPESTLFDQTILKCNWWFYVDCKATRSLYDTNIPVSKSYQLMKALTFFSSYKKEMQSDDRPTNPEDVDGIKEAISILENQENAVSPSRPSIEIISPRNKTDSNVFRINVGENPETQNNRVNRHFKNSTSHRQNLTQTKPTDSYGSDSKMYTILTNQTNSESREREQKRRRQPQRIRSTTAKTTIKTTTEQNTPLEVAEVNNTILLKNITPTIKEVIPEVKPTIVKLITPQITEITPPVEKINEKIDKIEPEVLASLTPVRRFYRSSAEIENSYINDEIVERSKPIAKIVGRSPTPTAAIASLDEAILGQFNRAKKEITIITPENSNYRYST